MCRYTLYEPGKDAAPAKKSKEYCARRSEGCPDDTKLFCTRCSPSAAPLEYIKHFRQLVTRYPYAATGNICVGRGVTIHDEESPMTKALLPAGIAAHAGSNIVLRRAALYQISARAASTGGSRPRNTVVTSDLDLLEEVRVTEETQKFYAQQTGELTRQQYQDTVKRVRAEFRLQHGSAEQMSSVSAEASEVAPGTITPANEGSMAVDSSSSRDETES